MKMILKKLRIGSASGSKLIIRSDLNLTKYFGSEPTRICNIATMPFLNSREAQNHPLPPILDLPLGFRIRTGTGNYRRYVITHTVPVATKHRY